MNEAEFTYDKPMSRRCRNNDHDNCYGEWTRYPDSSGPCECDCHGKTVELVVGTRFNTIAETGCTFVSWDGEEYKNKYTPTGKCRNFIAIDSDGIECQYSTMMVVGHPDFTKPSIAWEDAPGLDNYIPGS